jgi:DNA-binding XRE family transcriptional regulator
MNTLRLPSYLHSHRKRSGLSQRELARLLGYPDQGPVSRHERLCGVPPLMIALGYQAIFHQPVSDLFPGAYETVKAAVEERLDKLKDDLHQRSAKGRGAAMIARKLEWMWERENPEQSDSIHEPEVA